MALRIKTQKAEYDVVVVGGGMAGVCAAIASARGGAKTALIQDRPVLGGNASSEIRMHICGASTNGTKPNVEETGILYELMLNNKKYNERYNYSMWDAVVYQTARQQSGLTLYMNTSMQDVITNGDRSIVAVKCYQLTTEIHWEIIAKQFIDASGNGTLGFMAGADFRTGSESKKEFGEMHAPDQPDEYRMGNTLLFKAVDCGAPVKFEKPDWAWTFTEGQLRYRKHGDAQPLFGVDDQKAGVTVLDNQKKRKGKNFDAYCVDYGYWWIELCGTQPDIISEYEDIRDDLIGCVYGVWDHIKNGGDHGAENFDLLWVGMLPGVRESRRFEGDYMLTESDILANKRFDDTVAYGGWPMDNHTPNGLLDYDKLPTTLYNFPGVYGLPYRIFYSKNVPNLFLAGKIISCSKLAMSSTRVMGTCAVGGQAVGTAAALAIKYNCDPPDINDHMDELQQKLLKDDCYLPGIANHDEEDLARRAKVFAEAGSEHPEAVINGVTRNEQDVVNEWTSALLPARLWLQWDESICLSELQITFDTNLSRSIKQTMSSKRIKEQTLGLPPELTKDYSVVLYEKGKEVARQEVRGNYQRMNRVAFPNVRCDKAEIIVLATYGDSKARIFEVRAYSESK